LVNPNHLCVRFFFSELADTRRRYGSASELLALPLLVYAWGGVVVEGVNFNPNRPYLSFVSVDFSELADTRRRYGSASDLCARLLLLLNPCVNLRGVRPWLTLTISVFVSFFRAGRHEAALRQRVRASRVTPSSARVGGGL